MNIFKKKDFESVRSESRSTVLTKTLGSIDLILLGLAAIVGTGVFALTGLVAAHFSGPAVILSYLIAGITCIIIAFVYTELATMLPTSGSIYSYSYVAFGEVFAWMIGSIIIIELGVATSAVAGSWSAYIQEILDVSGINLPYAICNTPMNGGVMDLPAVLIVLFVGLITYFGIKDGKKLSTILVLVKILSILAFIIFASPHFDYDNWQNFMPNGFNDVLYGASILFFAFTGFSILASTAEECRNPSKDLRIGIIGSLTLSTIIYVIVAAILTGVVSYTELDSPQALAYALKVHNNKLGCILVAIGAIAGMTTVMMMNMYGQSRIYYVIARDGLLPKCMTKLHPKYGSPYITIIITIIPLSLLAAFVPYDILAKLSSMAALIDYTFIVLIVMIFRIRFPNVARPFKCPFVFVMAPLAFTISVYLLLKQVIDKNGCFLLTGKIIALWFIIMFLLYLLKVNIYDRYKKY